MTRRWPRACGQMLGRRGREPHHVEGQRPGHGPQPQLPRGMGRTDRADAGHDDRYRGPSPLSEPETQALAGYLDRYDFAATISYHSYGSIIYWEGAYTPELEARNRTLAELFAEKTGYALGVNEAETVERGGFKDWALGTRAIPSITVEIGAVDCFGSADEYAAILISHRGIWRQLADWAVENA